MENHEIILQDEHHKQFKIIKVQDVRFDKNTLNNSYQWLWIFDHSSEFSHLSYGISLIMQPFTKRSNLVIKFSGLLRF